LAGGIAYLNSPRYFINEDQARLNLWKTSLLSFVEHPVFGLGYRNFEVRSVELKQRYGIPKDEGVLEGGGYGYLPGHSHNNYLEAFASTGVFGGFAVLGFCAWWVREAYRSR